MTAAIDPNAGARRDEIDEQLQRIATTLDPAAANAPELTDRLRPILEKEVARLREQLATLRGNSRQQWQQLAQVSAKAGSLADEALAFVGGVEARSQGLDRQSCDLADELIANISHRVVVPYGAVTLPAAGEYLGVVSAVIRVRYPGRGIWDLPVAMHEFGHYLAVATAATWKVSPYGVIQREGADRRIRGSHAEELWADAFATFVCGPAYAAAALSRLDPVRADSDGSTHPSALKRAAVMFATLAHLQAVWMRSKRLGGSLDPVIGLVERLWSDRLAAANAPSELPEDDRSYATNLAAEFLAILDQEVVGSRYSDMSKARDVQVWLTQRQPPPVEPELVDVLNGAWWARRRVESEHRPDRVEQIAHAVEEYVK